MMLVRRHLLLWRNLKVLMNKLAILGASGHGKVIAECAELMALWDEIVFFDDAYPEKKKLEHWPIYGRTEDLIQNKTIYDVVIGIGDNKIRNQKFNELKAKGIHFVNVIHPSAILSKYVTLGTGIVVFAAVVINSFSKISDAVILNTKAVVEHDCFIDTAAHIAPNVSLAGAVTVGKCSMIGIGTSVVQLIKIADNITIGAGSVVIKDLLSSGNYAGAPARKLES